MIKLQLIQALQLDFLAVFVPRIIMTKKEWSGADNDRSISSYYYH